MNKATELFNKIYIDNKEIDLQELDNNNGKYYLGKSKKNINVKFVLNEEVNEIPSKLFNNTNLHDIVSIPEVIENIADDAFEGLNLPENSQMKIDKIKYGVYTEEEAIEYNAALTGAVKTGDYKEDIEEEYNQYNYIHDEESWNESFTNGALHIYYTKYPMEDLYSTSLGRISNINDWHITADVYDTNDELLSENTEYSVKWVNGDTLKIQNISTEDVLFIPRKKEEDENIGLNEEISIYSDNTLATSVGHIIAKSKFAPGFSQCWEGAVNANGAKYPWIAPYFTEDKNALIKFQYQGKNDVMPWGNSKIFGTGEGHKVWGAASVAEEFQDNTFLIEANKNNGDASWNGELGTVYGQFDISKFKLILIKQNVPTYTQEEAILFNSQLEGAKSAGDIKYPSESQFETDEDDNGKPEPSSGIFHNMPQDSDFGL